MTDIGLALGKSGATHGQREAAKLLGFQDAIDAVEAETRRSGLPGPETGGPGNAYKHLLITAELYRRFGPFVGPALAWAREQSNLLGQQSVADTKMDETNNAIVVNERPRLETWEDVVRWARGQMTEAAAHDGDGLDGRASWYEKQPVGWQPTLDDLPITPIEKGGAEHRYQPEREVTEPMGMADASETTGPAPRAVPTAPDDPLDLTVADWSQEDAHSVINAPAYWQTQHPRHEEAQRKVRDWYTQAYGTRPAEIDSTGRLVAEVQGPVIGGACPVPVRAHEREGGKVEVDAHCRAKPA